MSNQKNPLDSLAKPKHNVRQAMESIPPIGLLKEVPEEREKPQLVSITPEMVDIRKELFSIWETAYKVALMEVGKVGLCTLTGRNNIETTKKKLEQCKLFADLCLENYIETRKATIAYINDYTDAIFKGE